MLQFVQRIFGQRRSGGITLRSALLRLILVTLLPLALASGLIAWQLWTAQQAVAEDSLKDTAMALSLAVDREIAGVRGQLESVAGSRLVDERRWDELHGFLRSIVSVRHGAIAAIVDDTGQLLIQTSSDYGARLPNLWELEGRQVEGEWQGQRLPVSSQGLTRRVVETGAPAVSGVYLSISGRRPVVGLSVPVVRDGRTRYAVVYSFPTESLERLLGPAEATALRLVLIDQKGRVVAASTSAPDRVGAMADTASVRTRPADGKWWIVQRESADGTPVLAALAASELTGWTLRVSQPVAEALAPARRAVVAWLALFALVLLAAVLSAFVLSGRLASPLVELARSAGSGAAPPPTDSGIREIDVLKDRLLRAGETEAQRREELERRVAAEERERVAAESERVVREREEELRIALDAGDMGTWRVDAAGRVRSDARHRALWNLPADVPDFDAGDIRGRMHPDDVARVWVTGGQVVRESRFAVEFRVRDADGGWRWLAGHGVALADASGAFQGMVGVNFDVTERRQAEEALRQSEQQFRQITDNVDDVFWITDFPGRTVRYVSPSFERLWGLSREALLADPAYFMSRMHPEDVDRVDTAFENDAEHGRFDVEYRLRCPDGERWVHDRCFPLRNAEGQVYRMVGIAQDITERKRDEADLAHLAFVVESVDDGIVSLDLDGRVRTWNPAAERIYGVTAADAIGRRMAEIVEPQGSGVFPELLLQTVRGVPAHDVEAVHRRRDGTPLNVALTLALILVRDDVTGVAATIRDVTARKLYEQKLRRHLADLEEADRRKDHFLAMLGHELRNPLAPILNSARLILLAGGDRAVVERSALVVERQVEHLTRLIDDLLDVARITEGKIVLKRERLELMPLLNQALESTRPMIEARRQTLTIQPPSVAVFLEGDSVRLVQVLVNLVTNAAKYSPEGGRIHLEAVREVDRAVIRVRDNGLGIAADMLPRLFVPFTQATESLDRSQGGLGIGLALVKRLVEMHGGTVSASSAGPGRGSEFVVTLPLASDMEVPVGGEPKAARAGRATALDCLVVDDNADAADTLAALLQAAGHRTVVCHEAASALKAIGRSVPHLAILDIGLPGMDGYQLARLIRADSTGAQVFLAALTGYGQSSDARRAREAGFDLHLVKPLLPETLERLLARVDAFRARAAARGAEGG